MVHKEPLSARLRKPRTPLPPRLSLLQGVVLVLLGLLALRLVYLQVVRHPDLRARAIGQHELAKELPPRRGTIYMQDRKTHSLIPVALSQDLGFVYANPSEIEDPKAVLDALVATLHLTFEEERQEPQETQASEEDQGSEAAIVGTELDHLGAVVQEEEIEPGAAERQALLDRLSRTDDPYEPIIRGVPEEDLSALRALDLPGIHYTREPSRLYPERGVGGHVVGFVGRDDEGKAIGRYGVEGYFETLLRGTSGWIRENRDTTGALIPVGGTERIEPEDGVDLVLSIDRTIQYTVCQALDRAVKRHEAEGGSVVILEPASGDILAMCGSPDFYPGTYGTVESVEDFNNPVTFKSYEPGSVFKPITMAAALDRGAVSPSSTFVDTGSITVGPFTIKNSDGKAHGEATMTEVLEQSLNTGVVHVLGELGNDAFRAYVKAFGFGERVGLPLDTEAAGNISSLDRDGDVYAITASYGQGITVTPIQLAQAYATFANEGVMVRPRLVKELRYPDGVVRPVEVDVRGRVISKKAARLLNAMLVSVVESGHARRAGVSGYYLGGKTGTAQVARGGVYVEGESIGTFAGFGPVSDPAFVMVVRIDKPANNAFGAATAAPLFGEIADFLLEYLGIPPERSPL